MSLTETDEVLISMLKQNVGSAPSAAYRTMAQVNAEKDLTLEPEAVLSFRHREISVTVSAFHWLRGRLTYEPRLDRLFHHWMNKEANERLTWLQGGRDFLKWLDRRTPKMRITGVYGDGDPVTVYTYNEPNCLSQDIQFTYFETKCDRSSYVILQSHNGWDAREGMSRARIFRCDASELAMFDYNRVSISCDYQEIIALQKTRPFLPSIGIPDPVHHIWDSEDGGYKFHEQSEYTNSAKVELRSLPVVYNEDHPEYDEDQDQVDVHDICVRVDAQGRGRCPHCHTKLEAYIWP